LQDDSNGKIAICTGPIYGDADVETVTVTLDDRDPAEVPAAFFKVIVYADKNQEIAVRAFMIVQSEEVLKDRQ
jgi:DNA/RNA endonuclease G (NUC1)